LTAQSKKREDFHAQGVSTALRHLNEQHFSIQRLGGIANIQIKINMLRPDMKLKKQNDTPKRVSQNNDGNSCKIID